FYGRKTRMGIGVLYGKRKLLEAMPPFLRGGEMVEYVEEQETTFKELPYKFEAGTPNVEGAVGLAAAIEFLADVGQKAVWQHELALTEYALEKLAEIPYLTIFGPQGPADRGPVISFALEGCHPHDVATIVDSYGVALRAGHHCAQPLMNYLKAPATSRASFSLYNTEEEIDRLVKAIKKVREWLGHGS
ncbi:MAG TPA: aminotransferase class V-fold PLP-dependent enzyme, partial [Firmicutes bacterium]|nr:aminotransferase class V-fold PLP-dependent enzyme [Bacillota bacterium]